MQECIIGPTGIYQIQWQLYLAFIYFFVLLRHRLASGTSEKIQLGSLLAAFQVARDMVTSSIDEEELDS